MDNSRPKAARYIKNDLVKKQLIEYHNFSGISYHPSLKDAEMDYDFARCFEKLSGIVHTVDSDQAAAKEIAAICQSHNAHCIALAGLSDSMITHIETACSDLEIVKEPYLSKDLPAAIDNAEVGVTGISFAMAQSGTMVEVSTNDATRLVSSLPSTYIGVFRVEDIVDKYHDGGDRIREIASQHDSNLVISFISGPSRTADIELKLTLGVHGPEEAHAVIIDTQS